MGDAHQTPENRLRGLTEALETLPGGNPKPDNSWAGELVSRAWRGLPQPASTIILVKSSG
jgi:hypothetical protein